MTEEIVEYPDEIWKDIDGYPNYQVSNLCRVKNIKFNRILKPATDSRGYPIVTLYSNGYKRTRLVHRLAACAFMGGDSHLQINHEDGIKNHNSINNFAWTTQSENMKHAYRTGLHKSANVIRVVETGKEYYCINECAEDLCLDPRRIGECINDNHPRNEYGGYHFEMIRKAVNSNKPVHIKILETGEIFDSAGSCARAVKCDVGGLLRVAKEGGSIHGLHFEIIPNTDETPPKEPKPFLYDFQMEAVKKARNGCIFNGSVGSGKSRTGLFYYFKEQGGWIEGSNYIPMKDPKDLYIITTAKKRDSLEWNGELSWFRLSTDPDTNYYDNKVVVDSWNNIKKYADIKGAFFLLDEDRVTGTGAWVKNFLKIAKNNDWVILSATPGDTWMDYWAVFVANGFYRNKTEFQREHVIFSRFTKYPQIDRYVNTQRLDRLRDRILIDMTVQRHTKPHHEDVYCSYDIPFYKDIFKRRWDPFRDEPVQQASGMCYVLRRIVNSDESRQVALLELLEDHPKAIIFYNFDYEREILLNLGYAEGTKIAEWSGHAHQPIPTGDKWIYLTQYTSGCEGWNCITCDTIIFYSQNYSYKVMTQAAGRIDRLNTKFIDLYYYHLKSRSGIDLAISRALKEKKKFNEQRWIDSWKK